MRLCSSKAQGEKSLVVISPTAEKHSGYFISPTIEKLICYFNLHLFEQN